MATMTTDQEIIALERSYWQAMKDDDSDAAIDLTYDPCIVTGAQGAAQLDHNAMSRMNAEKEWALRDFHLDNMNVQTITNDVAVLGYTATLDMEVDGKPMSADFAESSTWVKQDGRWLCALHSESPIGDPFGRPNKRQKKS